MRPEYYLILGMEQGWLFLYDDFEVDDFEWLYSSNAQETNISRVVISAHKSTQDKRMDGEIK